MNHERIVLESSRSQFQHLVRQFIITPYEAINTFWAYIVLWLLLILCMPVGITYSALYRAHPKSAWALLGERIFRFYFYIAGVKIIVENAEYLPKEGELAVFAANHASLIDGFLFGAAYSRRAFAITQPVQKMPWPVNIWLILAGNISIARTPQEHRQFTMLPAGQRVVDAAVRKMQRRHKSCLIFPEGLVERQKKVKRFHTGAVRIALQAGVPIIPLTIKNAERVFSPNKFILWPGAITLKLHRPMDLRPYYGKQANHALVRRLTERVRQIIIRDMPQSYKQNLQDE